MNPSPVLIVGAGPTGMTMAIELKRAGLDVRIIDKSEHPALYSQALVVQARTLEQMQRYGIATKAVARGRKLKNVTIWSEGKSILSLAFERIPSRYPFLLFLPQSETETILNELMESLGVKTERKTELAAFTQRDGEIAAVLRHPDGSQEELRSRWIIGCDGAHSTVREQAAIPFEGGGVGLSFILGDLELDGPDAPDDGLLIHWHGGDVVFMGRLSDKITRVIIVVHSEQRDVSPRDLCIKDFQDPIDSAGIRIKIRSSAWMTPFHVNDRQSKHYRAGNVFLAGDASHIHSPVGGQGMNTGIQDAANLAWKLAAACRGADDSLLNSYEEERGQVGKALLKFTERGLKLATVSRPVIEAVRDALLPFVSGLQPVQKAMLGFVSETAIEYRSSSIVVDHGGDGSLRSGDRMPDLKLGGEKGGSMLLDDWTDSKHVALLLDPTDAEKVQITKDLAHARVVSLNASDLDQEGRDLLGTDKKLFILRPDGYIGFRGPLAKSGEREAYARQDGLN
jgi:2-polyprenyl-6-methoxyphenol hydroxylase-like FAD-dependent oxidoreductase